MADEGPHVPVTRDGDNLWPIECQNENCDGQQLEAISLASSNSVVVRVATDAERQQQINAPGAVALVVANEDASPISPVVAKVAVHAETGLRTLFIGTFEGKAGENPNFLVVLLTPSTIQRVDSSGSGDIAVGDHVLATSGSIFLASSGSGTVFVTSSDTMDLSRLGITTASTSDVDVVLSRVLTMSMEVGISGSGDISLFTNSISVGSEAVVTSNGSGSLCWSTNSSIGIEAIQIAQINSGDVFVTSTAGADAVCGSLNVKSVGSGEVDVGSVHCETANVVMFGGSDVTVQVSDSLTGKTIGGSGSIRYAGGAPRSLGHSDFGGSIASPVKSSYIAPKCKQILPPILLDGGSGLLAHQTTTAPVNGKETLQQPLSSTPSAVDAHQLDSLLPLGAIALIAALALWRFNSSLAKRRQESGSHYPKASNNSGLAVSKGEDKPLVDDYQPVYI